MYDGYFLCYRDSTKALGCVSVIEDSVAKEGSSLEAIAHTLQYAKYMIFLRDGDRSAAEAALWRLMQLPLTPFAVALSAVKALGSSDEEEAAGGGNAVEIEATPFYMHLASNYPK
jgi:hypothetical protein